MGTRDRGSVREPDESDPREQQFDLLTATLIGVAIGAGVTLLLRRGPSGRPISPVIAGVARGAKMAGALGYEGARWSGARGARAARWAADRGEELWDAVPSDEIAERLGEYSKAAREAIDGAVRSEIRDLRRAVRRQRKRLGI